MVSRTRIGLSLDNCTVRAVAVRRNAVVWSSMADLVEREDVAGVVARLLSACAHAEGARVVVALSPSFARVKRLHGLECVARSDLALRAVQQNPDRFFLSREYGIAVSTPVRFGNEWYAAAFAAECVASVADGCRHAGATLELTIPTCGALPEELRTSDACAPPATLQEYADAHMAAAQPGDARLSLVSDAQAARAARHQKRLRAALITSAALAAMANGLAPTISAEWRRREITASLVQERDSLRPVVATMSELARTSTALGEIERFSGTRRSMLSVLEALATKLPDSTAVLSLRADTISATIVMLTRSGPGVLQSLASIEGLQNAQVIGAFSREDLGGIPFDRVAVRAKLVPATRPVQVAANRTRAGPPLP